METVLNWSSRHRGAGNRILKGIDLPGSGLSGDDVLLHIYRLFYIVSNFHSRQICYRQLVVTGCSAYTVIKLRWLITGLLVREMNFIKTKHALWTAMHTLHRGHWATRRRDYYVQWTLHSQAQYAQWAASLFSNAILNPKFEQKRP